MGSRTHGEEAARGPALALDPPTQAVRGREVWEKEGYVIKLVLWKKGAAPAPYLVKGRPWDVAARFLAGAIRLGKALHEVYLVGWARRPQGLEVALANKVVPEVLRGGTIRINETPVRVPGWAYWALDYLGPRAAWAREESFWAWVGARAREEKEEAPDPDPRPREWAHEGPTRVGWREAVAIAVLLQRPGAPLRLLQEVEKRLWRGGLEADLEEEILFLHKDGSEVPLEEVLQGHPEAQAIEDWVKGKKEEPPPVPYPSLSEMEREVAQTLRGEGEPGPWFPHLLGELGLEWPGKGVGQPPRGVSPLWWVIYWGEIQGKWGALAERLGVAPHHPLVAKARKLQRAAAQDPKGALEGWAQAAGLSLEEAEAIWGRLHPLSLEGWMEGLGATPFEEPTAEEKDDDLPTYEEVLEREDRERQRAALRAALEATGLKVEEVLADPRLVEEVGNLARAFYDPGA